MPYTVNRGQKVRHNGITYGPGENIPGLKKDEAQRLIDLGAVSDGKETSATAGNEGGKAAE